MGIAMSCIGKKQGMNQPDTNESNDIMISNDMLSALNMMSATSASV